MDTRSNMQQNILLINSINSNNFGGMTPLVKSSSDHHGFILDIVGSMEELSVIGKKTKQMDLFSKINSLRNSRSMPTFPQSQRQNEKGVNVEIVESTQAVVGICSKINLKILDSKGMRLKAGDLDLDMVLINEDEGQELRTLVSCDIHERDDLLAVSILPQKVGQCLFILKSKERKFSETEFSVEIYGNNPEISFSESGNDWPLTVAFKHADKCVYIAFNHHISKFTEDGEFVKVILRVNDAYINDLAVDPCKARLVLGVSGWRESRGYRFRFQEVRMYSMTGTHMWTLGKNQPLLFGAPILHVAFNAQGNVIVAGHKSVDICHKVTGNVEYKVNLQELITPSRVCTTPGGGCAIIEATEGTIQLYDKFWNLKQKVPIVDLEGKKVEGVSGLAVDNRGNILVSSCAKEEFFMYNEKGELTSVIESDWDCPKWPLDLTATNDGYVFVADHGHACAKKYKYL